MKKIFTVKKADDGNYWIYKNPMMKDKSFEYEFTKNSPLDLVWQSLDGDGDVIPLMLFTVDYKNLNFVTENLRPVMIDEDTLRIYSIKEDAKYVDIPILNYKKIWQQYENFKNQDADEITIERINNQFSISAIWYEKKNNKL